MEKQNLILLILSGILIIILIGASYYKLEKAQVNDELIEHIQPDKTCNLHKSACALSLSDGGEIILSIEPRPIPLVKNLNISVTTHSVKAESVLVDFKGTTMNMGPNQVSLSATTPELFEGKGLLPVCIRDRMEWRADVYLKTKKGVILAPFIFETVKSF